MNISQIKVGAYRTNCYLLKQNNEVLIIDPGSNFEKISSNINENEKVIAILLTHGHFDHIGAVDDLVNKYHCPVYINEDDLNIATNPKYNYDFAKLITVPLNFYTGNNLVIGSFSIDLIYNPGHTDGSTSLVIGQHMFVGDFIFKNSIGRTDLYSGSISKMNNSLKMFKSLPHDWIVYPGHEDITSVHDELLYNPYLK